MLDFVALDCETTGLDALEDCVVEVAAVRFTNGNPFERFESLVRPTGAISPTSSAVHGISDDDVRFAPPESIVLGHLASFIGDSYVIAHNADFDRAYVGSAVGKRWICTLKLARYMWPNAPTHSLQGLRYWLALNKPSKSRAACAHTAHGDALLAGELFLRELRALPHDLFAAGLSAIAAFTDAIPVLQQ